MKTAKENGIGKSLEGPFVNNDMKIWEDDILWRKRLFDFEENLKKTPYYQPEGTSLFESSDLHG